jgi:AraC family transcriptional regulator, transcriptional activator of pobA
MTGSIPTYPLPAPIVVREARGDRFGPDPDMLIPHRKDYYLFVLVRKGDSRHWVDARSYTLQPDHFYFTVPHQVHLKEEPRPMYGLALAFTREFLELEEHRPLLRLPILANRAGGHELRLTPEDVVALEGIMRQLLQEYQGDGVWRTPMLGVLLHQLLIHLSRLYLGQCKEESQEATLLKRFLELVGEHYAGLHEVNAYAALLHVSPGHLNEIVKAQSGKTCLEHIQDQLLVEAKRRLLHTELPVNLIGDDLGFDDAAYFNRFFKRHTDLTPLTYRKQIREKYHYVLPESSDALPKA